jgi:hypothetical protein
VAASKPLVAPVCGTHQATAFVLLYGRIGEGGHIGCMSTHRWIAFSAGGPSCSASLFAISSPP